MIQIDYRSEQPIYEQIIEQIKLYVIKGQLSGGDAIPSVRKMAQSLGVTPSTVAKAYQELERQKVIETIRAKGTFIAQNIDVSMGEEQMERIRQRMKSEILELKRNGYSAEDVVNLAKEIYESI
ncbi:MAG: GntR family transcriptional regulator [Lachnospiraceae bacterium]|nr:GntR family transcriptional regulator [Lachnospiraceae bacterium]